MGLRDLQPFQAALPPSGNWARPSRGGREEGRGRRGGVHLGDARSSPVPSVVAYGDTRWEGKECGGRGARRRVPDIAGEVGSGDVDLEDSEEDPIFGSWGDQARAQPKSVVRPRGPAIISGGDTTLAKEGTPEPTKGMVVVRGQEEMIHQFLLYCSRPVCWTHSHPCTCSFSPSTPETSQR